MFFAKSSIASFERPVRPKIGVSIGPGATAFTRMLRSTSALANDRVSERIAALVAAYTEPVGSP